MRGFPRLVALLLVAGLVAGLLTGPSPAGAQEETGDPPLTLEQAWMRLLGGFALGVDLGTDPQVYEELSMTLGTPLATGFPALTGVSHGVFAAPPREAYGTLAETPNVEVLSPGDAAFGEAFDMSHFYALEFEAMPTGVGELGVALKDAGGAELADPSLPFAPTTAASRTIAAVFAPDVWTAVYGVVNRGGTVDPFASPFFVATASAPDGRFYLFFVGPFGPLWWPYVSGAAGADPSDADLLSSLAGYRLDDVAPAVEQATMEEVEQALADTPRLAELVAFLLGTDTAPGTDGGNPPVEQGPAGEPDDGAVGAPGESNGDVTPPAEQPPTDGVGTGADGSTGEGDGGLLFWLLLLAALLGVGVLVGARWIIPILTGLLRPSPQPPATTESEVVWRSGPGSASADALLDTIVEGFVARGIRPNPDGSHDITLADVNDARAEGGLPPRGAIGELLSAMGATAHELELAVGERRPGLGPDPDRSVTYRYHAGEGTVTKVTGPSPESGEAMMSSVSDRVVDL